jgi:hypothetical protein
MLTADQTIWDESISRTPVEKPFIEKDMLYIQDQNNGSYSGQIQFDCSSLANNNRYLSYSEAYFQFPIVITAKGTGADYSTLFKAFSIGLKNGYYQFIDQIQVDLNQQNVVQLQNNLNVLVNYKLLTSMSQDDLEKLGPVLGVYPDSSDSYQYANADNANGDGYSNNINITPVSTFDARANSNVGLLKRQKDTIGNNTAFVNLPTAGTSIADTSETYKKEGRNYYVTNGAGVDMTFNWVIIATLRLKDLCDFFDKVPISKGLNLRFTINYNSFSARYTTTTGPTIVTTSYTQLSGHTCPIMIPSVAVGSSNAGLAIAGSFDVTCNIGGSTLDSSIKPAISTTRLYVPAYKLDPDYESSYLKDMPISKVRYFDYYTYTVDSVDAGNTFNAILTNGLLNPKAIIVVPFVKNTSTGNTQKLSQLQNAFDSAGGTTAPQVSITNFQVLIAGQNVFNNNEVYTFSQFLDEFQHLFAVNGSNTTGINSGLIGKYDWDNAYRFYVCDLSRRVKFEDKIPKSVQIEGTNNSKTVISYMTFVLYEREISLRTSTGEVVNSVP